MPRVSKRISFKQSIASPARFPPFLGGLVLNPSGQNIASLFLRKIDLTQEQQDNVMSVLCTVVGEDPLAFDMNVDNLPKLVVFQGKKILELDWQPVVDESSQTVAKMLLAIKDVTTLRELEERNKQVQGDMQIIARLLKS